MKRSEDGSEEDWIESLLSDPNVQRPLPAPSEPELIMAELTPQEKAQIEVRQLLRKYRRMNCEREG